MTLRNGCLLAALACACGNEGAPSDVSPQMTPTSDLPVGPGAGGGDSDPPPDPDGVTTGNLAGAPGMDPNLPDVSMPEAPLEPPPAVAGTPGVSPAEQPSGSGGSLPTNGEGGSDGVTEPPGISGGPGEPTAEPDPVAPGGAGSGGGTSVPVDGTPVEAELAELPVPRGEHGVATLNDEVYVMCGFTPQVTAAVDVYDPATDTWRDAADVPVVCHHPNVATIDGRIYILGFHGGSGQRMADGSAFAYDPNEDAWTEVASQPVGTQRGASCITTFEGKAYVFGGTNDIALPDASTYDPATDEWAVLPPMPMPRHHCIAAVVNDLIYIVSGRDVIIEEVHTESFVYDPVLQTYEEVAPILTPRGGGAGGELGGRIYVFGGEGNVDDERGIFHEAEVYDPATDTWSALPDMGVPRHGFGAVVIGNRMYFPGGSRSQGIDATSTLSVFYYE